MTMERKDVQGVMHALALPEPPSVAWPPILRFVILSLPATETAHIKV